MSKKIHSKYMYKEPSVLSMLAFVYISNNTTRTYCFFSEIFQIVETGVVLRKIQL